LLAIVQIPGLSHLLGCRPLGPLGLAQAAAASAAAAGSAYALRNAPESVQALPDRAVAWVRERTSQLRSRSVEFVGANEEEASDFREPLIVERVRGLARDLGNRLGRMRVVASQRQ
jgi:hypothetical protein